MRLFGTDGIRGRVNSSPMTPEKVLRVGMASSARIRGSRAT
jgi:phosphoglucosamine mutase